MSGPFEWRIQDIERTANRAESRLYELDSLRSDVGSLEHTVRELRAEIDGLRAELQASQIQHTQDIAELESTSPLRLVQKQAERIKELETEFAGCSELLDNADRIMEQQSAALKLAREALKFDGYPCGTGCKCIACESLAAIDEVLKGE